jgi:transposase
MVGMDAKDQIIEELRLLIEQQRREIEELKLKLAKGKKDSSNSSKPPSSDIVKPPNKIQAKKRGRGKQQKRKRGGQPGHKRQMRKMLPPERVDETFVHDIDEDEVQRLGLTATDEFDAVQKIELVELPIHVIEHRLRVYLTPDNKRTTASVPEAKGPIFGPRMLATIVWMKSVAHCSYSTIETWMTDLLGVPVSRGYLSKLCTGVVSDSLAEAYDEIKEAIPRQEQLGSDETGFKNNGEKRWVWAICSKDLTLFHIAASRSAKVLDELVGPDFQGFFNADYFSANCSFAWHNDVRPQFCWAHLIRDIRFLLTHSSKQVIHWAEQLLKQTKRLFRSWHARDEMSEATFNWAMRGHRNAFMKLMLKPPPATDAEKLTARFSTVHYEDDDGNLQPYDQSENYFRFMSAPDLLEPTNNHCEQQIRHCVIDRRITQGTRSDVGQRYNERMWSIAATCAKQARRFFDFLHESISAHLAKKPSPALLG